MGEHMEAPDKQIDKRDRILEAGTLLFAKYGAKKTTIDEIAKEAGVAKGTVYLYFSSKEDILIAVGRKEVDLILTSLRQVVRAEGTAAKKLKSFLTTRFSAEDALQSKYGSTQEILQEHRDFPQIEKVKEEYYAAELHIIRDIVEFGIDSGEFRDLKSTERVCTAISYMMLGLEETWCDARGIQLTVKERVDLVLDLIINGLASKK